MTKTLVQKCLLSLGLIAGAGMVSATRAEASDCGAGCYYCGFFGREGDGYTPFGTWALGCTNWSSMCSLCGDASIGRPAGEVDAIAEAVKMSSATELTAVARRYGGRLLINSERNMVVIQGSNCDPTALTTAFFVPAERIAALKEAGVRPLQSFLASRAREAVGRRA